VNFNRRAMLMECFQSLASQTWLPDEVILVDNGSTDGSVDVASLFPALNIRVIQNATNRGFCAANNQGFAIAKGRYFALLNNDAVADPDWLESLAGAFALGPKVGMAASKILVYAQRDKIDKAGHLIYWDGQNRGRGTGQVDVGQFDRIEEILWPDGCAAMYSREMIDEIGGFDEEFFAYADDAELGLRGRLAGWQSFYMPQARVYHHRGSTLGVHAPVRIELIERNRILLVLKHFPWSLVWLNGVFYLLRVSAGVVAAIRGKGEAGRIPGLWPKFRSGLALLWGAMRALPLIPSMLRKRRQFRPLRRLSNRELWRLLRKHSISLKELSEQST
jgi:GT2 family glycosyltransferase